MLDMKSLDSGCRPTPIRWTHAREVDAALLTFLARRTEPAGYGVQWKALFWRLRPRNHPCHSGMPAERIVGMETGSCPQTVIREDASINLAAIQE